MEKFQSPLINHHSQLVGEDLDVGWLEEFVNNNNSNSYRFEEDPYCSEGGDTYTVPSLEFKIPFLQMLQSVETPQQQQQHLTTTTTTTTAAVPFMQEPNYFQLLLRLQHQPNWSYTNNLTSPNELDTCGRNEDNIIGMHHLPVKSEICKQGGESDYDYGHTSALVSQNCDTAENVEKGRVRSKKVQTVEGCKGRRKRKRSVRPAKNKEEVESQRMTHIAVERNRRRQMNDHLNSLRSLMPPSYVHRGDQASIIGGAIDFVKELEQMLQTLQAQKRMRQCEETTDVSAASSSASSSLNNMFMPSPTSPFQFRNFSSSNEEGNGDGNSTEDNANRRNNNSNKNNNNEEFSAENRSALADIEVVVIQNHVNLKIQCQRRPGQLLKAIVAFEELKLTILHLNITSLHTLVHYSFNLKIEDGCKLGSADEVAKAVHQIFSLINLSLT